jgi:hypothetical protein
MRIFFIIGFFGLLEYQCKSSEDLHKEEDNLLQTHKVEREESGDDIFYPKEYENYNDFKEKYVENIYIKKLLCKRLEILNDLIKDINNYKKVLSKINYDYFENLLSRNNMAIISNSKKGEFDPDIFNIKYDENSIVNHTIKIASVLKTKFLGENNELNEFIGKLQDTR